MTDKEFGAAAGRIIGKLHDGYQLLAAVENGVRSAISKAQEGKPYLALLRLTACCAAYDVGLADLERSAQREEERLIHALVTEEDN